MVKFRTNLPLLANDRIYFGEGGIMTSFFFGEETKDIKVPPGNIFLHFTKDKRIMKWEENYLYYEYDIIRIIWKFWPDNGYG